MKTETRIKYDGMPDTKDMPQDVQRIIEGNIENAGAKDLRHARSVVNSAIQSESIPEDAMLEAMQYMKRSKVRLDELAQQHRNIEAKMSSNSANSGNTRSAFSIHNSVGDSPRSIAQGFSLTRAIERTANGQPLEGAEAEAYTEARKEFRGARGNILIPSWMRPELRSIYGNDSGQSGIAGNVGGRQTLSFGDTRTALHTVPMAEQLGAQKVNASGGGTLLVPFLGRTAAATADEGAAGSSTTSTFSELTLTPQRYTRKTSISALSLSTTGSQLDRILLNDFEMAHAAAHDRVCFAAIRDSATFTTATASANGLAATTIADLFNLASDTMNATGISGYPDLLMSPIAQTVLNTGIVTNSDQTLGQLYVSQTGKQLLPIVSMVDGTFAEADAVSGASGSDNIVGAGHVVAGLMSSCILASWDGISIMSDPFTLRDEHAINVHADSYVASGVIQDAFRILAVSAADIDATA